MHLSYWLNVGVLFLWYAFVWALILLFKWVFRTTNIPKFRDSHGDITHEVGYFEDSTGRPLRGHHEQRDSEDSRARPHAHV